MQYVTSDHQREYYIEIHVLKIHSNNGRKVLV